GNIGNGSTNFQLSPTVVRNPANTGPLTNIRAITVGADQACALDGLGEAFCWGDNAYGELGNGVPTLLPDGGSAPTPLPVQVSRSTSGGASSWPMVSISSGANYTCARSADGSLWCWGGNPGGANGTGTADVPNVPARNVIPEAVGAGPSVTTSGWHTCVTST